jgi:hypothetical protein
VVSVALHGGRRCEELLCRGGDNMPLLKLSIHLNSKGEACGGGWAVYDYDGPLLASQAIPDLTEPEDPGQLAEYLVDHFMTRRGHQLAF